MSQSVKDLIDFLRTLVNSVVLIDVVLPELILI